MAEDDIRIIQGDCLEVMAGMEAGSVDAIVTDPPFGVRGEAWDDMDDREFARFSMAWLSQARRIAPELITFCTQDSRIIDLCRMLYRRVRQLIWFKPHGSQYAGASECGLWYSYETILHCHDRPSWSVVQPKGLDVANLIRKAREAKGLPRTAVDMALRGKKTGLCYRWEEAACLPTRDQAEGLAALLGLDGEFSAALAAAYESRDDTLQAARAMASEHAAEGVDVFTHRTVTGGAHPCQKPLPLMSEILSTVGADYRRILDPFAGSGTTLLACQKAGKHAVGIEADPKYVRVINQRLRGAATPLFDLIEALPCP